MKGTILIVEDEPAIREIEKTLLEGKGFSVRMTEDPEEGLAILQKEKINLVVLDIMLPKFDGFEFLRRARTVPAAAKVPIIVLSAFTEHRDRIKGLNLGAIEYLGKPFRAQELVRTIEECLDSTGQGQPGASA